MAIHTEFFWSQASAERAGQRLNRRHGFSYSVRNAMRADGSRDWLLTVSA
ncbi:hypothetical protein SH584_11345 [Sphingomonas sp. LY29]|nr:hypothetical protein [Sphingomonas sp. LY29]WRP25626.1 hypothetical protein SH584_11345 [Sphingomonas sp. LY29]